MDYNVNSEDTTGSLAAPTFRNTLRQCRETQKRLPADNAGAFVQERIRRSSAGLRRQAVACFSA